MKRLCAILLALALLLSFAACNKPAPGGSGGEEKETTEAFVESNAEISGEGEYVYFGCYPQSQVDDEEILDELNDIDAEWISYGYLYGQGEYDAIDSYPYFNNLDGALDEVKESDFMKYADVELDGVKYRGVQIDDFRPCQTIKCFVSEQYDDIHVISENPRPAAKIMPQGEGYWPGSVYWFEYEPIKWKVLDLKTGLVLCDSIIDSQPYLNVTTCSLNEYWQKRTSFDDYEYEFFPEDYEYFNEAGTSANDWENSSIRAFLNNDFFNTAFGDEEQKIISTTACINRGEAWAAYDNPVYDQFPHNDTKDKVFLLSLRDVTNPAYGFGETDEDIGVNFTTIAYGTDYAFSQGLSRVKSYHSEAQGASSWLLRTPEDGFVDQAHSYRVTSVFNDGTLNDYENLLTFDTTAGVRPAIRINGLEQRVPELEIPERDIPEEDKYDYEYVTFGSYPQSEVKDKAILDGLNKMKPRWISYEYWSGEGWDNPDSAEQSDYMSYADVEYNGNRYRGVRIKDYRPDTASDSHMAYDDAMGDVPAGNAYSYGYDKGTYWFLYEPLKWIVYDRDSGVLVSASAIDSQPFNEFVVALDDYGYDCYTDYDGEYVANDYSHSSIREWLNNDFYNTAFDNEEKRLIAVTDLDVPAITDPDVSYYDEGEYIPVDGETVSDRIYLLSYADVSDESKGFGEGSDAIFAECTDYARCQGVDSDSYYHYGAACWSLRNPGHSTDVAAGVYCYGYFYGLYLGEEDYLDTDYTGLGVRPAITVTDIDAIS